jgi:outer membrane protein
MKYVLSCLIVLAWANAAGSELTLQQALQMAEVHSLGLKQSRAGTLEAAQTVRAAQAERYPTLSGVGAASYINTVPTLSIAIPNLFTLEREMGSKERYQADLRLTVPLFTGGKISSAVDMAKANEAYWRALENVDLNAVRYATRAEYFGLYRSLQLRETARASLKRTTIIKADIAAQFDAGAADSVDVVEAELACTKADFAGRQAEIGVRTAEIQLLTRLGSDIGDSIRPSEPLPSPPELLPADSGLSKRPELDAALAGIDLNRAEMRKEKAEYFPNVAVYSGYSYGKPNQNLFANKWNYYVTVGANLTWSFNLGNKTGAKRAGARMGFDAARYNHDQLTERVTKEARLAYEQLKLAHEQYLRARAEQRLAKINFRLAQDRHREGVLSSNRLVELETTLTLAESSLAAAVADYYIAEGGYLYAIGSENLGKGL